MNVEILQNVRNKVHVVTKCNIWFFSWQSPGRPCRRPFDGGLAMQLKQAPPFMGRWNTLWTWPFIIRAPVNQRTNFIDRLLFAKHFVTQFWNVFWCQKMFPSLRQQSWPNQFGQKPKMKNCKFLAGHLVMSMRQGWGGDLCNRGDPPSNMTAHRYQPSPNIKWTRLPFSHEHKSFPKPPPQCVCVPERSSWFSRGRGEAICEGKGSSTLHRHRARSSSRDRWPPPSTPLHGMALLQKTSKWEYGGWKQMLFTQTIRVKSCVIFILVVNLKKKHTLSTLPKLHHCCDGVQNTTFKSHLQAKWRFEYLCICLANWVEMLRARSRARCWVRIL